jgi:hypothetical protein
MTRITPISEDKAEGRGKEGRKEEERRGFFHLLLSFAFLIGVIGVIRGSSSPF